MSILAAPPHPTADLERRLAELEALLVRERARRAGLEAGIDALTARIETLRAENAALRGAS